MIRTWRRGTHIVCIVWPVAATIINTSSYTTCSTPTLRTENTISHTTTQSSELAPEWVNFDKVCHSLSELRATLVL